jgi:multidrug resistance efflux pump
VKPRRKNRVLIPALIAAAMIGSYTSGRHQTEIDISAAAAERMPLYYQDPSGKADYSPKFEGWIEKLLVNTTGQAVRRGEALLQVYSPDLVLAQREYLVARSAAADMAQADAMARDNAKAIAAAALSRLKNWDISADQLARLQRTGTATRTLTLSAPIGGIVMEKAALQGLHFAAGDMLYRIVDLSTVWLLADVFEQDLAQIRPGQSATITVQAYPGRVFDGRVAFVYPTVNAQTRTAKVRIEVPNPRSAAEDGYVCDCRDRGAGRERTGACRTGFSRARHRHPADCSG